MVTSKSLLKNSEISAAMEGAERRRTSNTAESTRTALNLEREIDMSVYSHVR